MVFSIVVEFSVVIKNVIVRKSSLCDDFPSMIMEYCFVSLLSSERVRETTFRNDSGTRLGVDAKITNSNPFELFEKTFHLVIDCRYIRSFNHFDRCFFKSKRFSNYFICNVVVVKSILTSFSRWIDWIVFLEFVDFIDFFLHQLSSSFRCKTVWLFFKEKKKFAFSQKMRIPKKEKKAN